MRISTKKCLVAGAPVNNLLGDESMGGMSSGSYPPQAFEKAMVFIDGSNLFPRLKEAKLKVPSFNDIAKIACRGRTLHRAYLYTCQEKLDKAIEEHGEESFKGCRIVLGESVKLENGGHREKGVDALLVADLVYHVASRNCQFAAVLSNDLDFSVALKRVEDFGCRTGVLSLIHKAPEKLIKSCDDYFYLTAGELISSNLAISK